MSHLTYQKGKYAIECSPQASGFSMPHERNMSQPVDRMPDMPNHGMMRSSRMHDPRRQPMGAGWRMEPASKAQGRGTALQIAGGVPIHRTASEQMGHNLVQPFRKAFVPKQVGAGTEADLTQAPPKPIQQAKKKTKAAQAQFQKSKRPTKPPLKTESVAGAVPTK